MLRILRIENIAVAREVGLQNLGQLVNNVKNYCDQHGEEATLEGYLEDIALISDIDSYNESADQVVLMTIHSCWKAAVLSFWIYSIPSVRAKSASSESLSDLSRPKSHAASRLKACSFAEPRRLGSSGFSLASVCL